MNRIPKSIKINSSVYSYTLLFINLKQIVLAFFLLGLSLTTMAQKPMPTENKQYILALTSSDCVNCNAMSFSIVEYFKKTNTTNQLLIVTDNEIGAYYLSKNEHVFKNIKSIIDKSLCDRLTPKSKSTISYINSDTITILIKYGIDSLNKLINLLDNNHGYKQLKPSEMDSTYIEFDVFKNYYNYVIKTQGNLFLYSKASDAGCFLMNNQDTSKLLNPELSISKYDSFYNQLLCNNTSNVPQSSMRDISKNIGIPLTKIYSIANDESNYYLLFNFFTGHSDTIRSKEKENVKLNFVYNICIAKNNVSLISNPINFSNYEIKLKIVDSFIYSKVKYKVRTITDFFVSENYIFLPVAIEENFHTIDSLFFIAKYKKNEIDISKPLELLYYPSGNFSQLCFFRTASETPILINKINKTIDFGEKGKQVKYNQIQFSENIQDTIDEVFDFFPINENNIKIIASTKNGKLLTAHFVDKIKIEKIKYINEPNDIFHCQYLDPYTFIILSKNNHKIVTKKYFY